MNTINTAKEFKNDRQFYFAEVTNNISYVSIPCNRSFKQRLQFRLVASQYVVSEKWWNEKVR